MGGTRAIRCFLAIQLLRDFGFFNPLSLRSFDPSINFGGSFLLYRFAILTNETMCYGTAKASPS